jgi:class 3 adenylate cyclase
MQLRPRIAIAHGPVSKQAWPVQGCHLIDYHGDTVNAAARVEALVSLVGGFALALCVPLPHVTVMGAKTRRLLSSMEVVRFRPWCPLLQRLQRDGKGGLQCGARLVPYSMTA